MERLTYDYVFAESHCWQIHGADNFTCAEVCKNQGDDGCDGCPVKKAIDRLAAYENTGLEPEEVVALQASSQELKKEAVPLLEEKIKGRLVILPCKEGDTVFAAETSPVIPLSVRSVGVYLEGADGGDWESLENFGETVFLTREAAEAALIEQNGKSEEA